MHRLYDVGIAGIHRLFASLDTIRRSHACVAVAGMDGALPTVVAGAFGGVCGSCPFGIHHIQVYQK